MKTVCKLLSFLKPPVLGGMGFLSGFYFIIFDKEKNFSESLNYMMRAPEVTVWCLLIAGQAALWFGFIIPVIKKLWEYRWWKKISLELVFTIFIIVGLCLLFIQSHQKTTDISSLPNFPINAPDFHRFKVNILNIAGILLIFPTLLGGYFVGHSFKQLKASVAADSGTDSVKKFLKYKEDLNWFLTVVGLMVGGATLTTGALHRALSVLNTGYKPNSLLILLYGAYISGIVALIFIPAIIKAHATGSALREKLLPFPENEIGGEEWIKWSENRSKLDAMLGLNKDVFDNLKVGLAILTPLAASAVSLFIGKG